MTLSEQRVKTERYRKKQAPLFKDCSIYGPGSKIRTSIWKRLIKQIKKYLQRGESQNTKTKTIKMERYHKKQAHSFKVSSNDPFQILSDLTTGDRRQLINQIKKYLQNGKAEDLDEKR